MGLDMYLTNEIYIGAKYKHREVTGKIELFQGKNPVAIDLSKVSSITEDVGYWRKANQIHKWFVDNVQGGEDDCQEHYVDYEQLLQLKALCEKVLETKDASLLPPQDGFFFGGTEISEYYFQDLKDTIEIIDGLNEGGNYYYRASW